jgi:hypothetical protein
LLVFAGLALLALVSLTLVRRRWADLKPIASRPQVAA